MTTHTFGVMGEGSAHGPPGTRAHGHRDDSRAHGHTETSHGHTSTRAHEHRATHGHTGTWAHGHTGTETTHGHTGKVRSHEGLESQRRSAVTAIQCTGFDRSSRKDRATNAGITEAQRNNAITATPHNGNDITLNQNHTPGKKNT